MWAPNRDTNVLNFWRIICYHYTREVATTQKNRTVRNPQKEPLPDMETSGLIRHRSAIGICPRSPALQAVQISVWEVTFYD